MNIVFNTQVHWLNSVIEYYRYYEGYFVFNGISVNGTRQWPFDRKFSQNDQYGVQGVNNILVDE